MRSTFEEYSQQSHSLQPHGNLFQPISIQPAHISHRNIVSGAATDIGGRPTERPSDRASGCAPSLLYQTPWTLSVLLFCSVQPIYCCSTVCSDLLLLFKMSLLFMNNRTTKSLSERSDALLNLSHELDGLHLKTHRIWTWGGARSSNPMSFHM